MKIGMPLAGVCLFVSIGIGAAFEPPTIVSTSPKFWSVGVDAKKQNAISVTFGQPMRPGFSSWLGESSIAPDVQAEATISQDLRTFSLSLHFEPGKVYVFGLNEVGLPGVGFQTEKGLALRPTYLVFQTAGNPSQEDAPPRALSTFPGNASQDVNPATTKSITVTFDRPMQTKKHGFHLFEEKKPADLKGVSFTYSPDGKIFMLNYPLKPSTRYEVVMNCSEDIGFAATNRAPL
nr:Ig-like domain-containing protein [Pyrinomonadaceae bacterium]